MQEELNTKNTEIVEDMPDFEGNTAEMPCESEKSVDECTDVPENENVSEETEAKTEGETPDAEADTDTEAEEDDEKSAGSAENKEDDGKSNLPADCSFNPLVFALKPFYKELIAEDELFANEVKEKEGRSEKPKSLAECAEYILGEAYHYAYEHRNGECGMSVMPDEDMKSLIKHYYDEDDIVIRKMGAGTRVATARSNTPTATPPVNTAKKGKEKPKPKANVIDITKAITAKPKAEDGTKPKREKKKDNLNAGFVPMERPETEKDAKKGSREQAKGIVQMDMFAEFFSE